MRDKISLAFIFTVCTLNVDASSIVTQLDPVQNEARVEHAKEILGDRFYSQSVVRQTEQEQRLQDFIFRQTQIQLKSQWGRHAFAVTQTIISESRKYNMDPLFLMAVIKHESRFNPTIIGSHGEVGLMQIKPDTAEWVSKKFNLGYDQTMGRDGLKNMVLNIKIGAAYLSLLRKKFSSNSDRYLAAYNMGAASLRRALRNHVSPKDYSNLVKTQYLGFYRTLASVN